MLLLSNAALQNNQQLAVTDMRKMHGGVRDLPIKKPTQRIGFFGRRKRVGLDEFAHRNSSVAHPVREAPFVVIPRQDAHHIAVQNLGLVQMEDR
jgi:hypothetical protein